MDEKYIQDLYNQLGGESKFGKYDDFKYLISTDQKYRQDFHNSIGEKVLGSYDDFDALVKKKTIQQVLHLLLKLLQHHHKNQVQKSNLLYQVIRMILLLKILKRYNLKIPLFLIQKNYLMKNLLM